MQRQPGIVEPTSELNRLRHTLGAEWLSIQKARSEAQLFRDKLESGLFGTTSEDTSVVVFGSLARDEFTNGSDVDWTVLIDGAADPKHLDLARQVKGLVASLEANQPGPEGIFGNMAFSHEIIHQIGGEDDTNSNTTKRILLILESLPIGRREAYDRVLNHVLGRYIAEDARFLQLTVRYHVPRFLLNDFARYWRTMAVDFAYKRRMRDGTGTSIRNIKLRMSRKLIFVSGLLACFSYHVLLSREEQSFIAESPDPSQEFVRHLRRVLSQTPLEIVAGVINRHENLYAVGTRLFGAYDEFLGALRDKTKRTHLDDLTPATEGRDPLFQQLRTCSHTFRDALVELFFDEPSGLNSLTKTYGVF
jgi:predicted nucleotidyltransferase